MSETEVQNIDEESTPSINLKPLNPKDGDENALSPFRLGQLTRNTKILEVSAVISALTKADDNFSELARNITNNQLSLSRLDSNLKFLLNTRGLAGKMIATQNKVWYYDNDEILHEYSSIPEALDKNPGFSGTVTITEDMTWNNSSVGSSLYLSSGNNLVFDLDGNTLNLQTSYGFATVTNNTNVTFKNGTISASIDGTVCKATQIFCLANGGQLDLKSVDVTVVDQKDNENYIKMFVTQGYDPYTLSTLDHNGTVWNIKKLAAAKPSDLQNPEFQSQLSAAAPISVGPCKITVDRFCNLTLSNAFHGYDMFFWLFGPYDLVSAYAYGATGVASNTYSAAKAYGLTALKPQIFLDGKAKLIVDSTHSNISADVDLQNTMYGTYMNGSHRIGSRFEIGPNGEINVQHGHGIYSAQETVEIVLNGGRVIGDNGITMRGGTLIVPQDANPTVIGNANYSKYNPAHASGQAGAGIFLGHAVMIEACADPDSGYGAVSADIKSGSYISKNNTSIASVGAAKSSKDWATNKATYDRMVGFVEGGMLNRSPALEPYEIVDSDDVSQVYAKNTDYQIVAAGFATSTPTMIIKQDAI